MDQTDKRTITADITKPAIFVHSGFRTSSTWLWTKFRENRSTISYSEIFHEDLQNVSYSSVNYSAPQNWKSRHPNSAPYLMEYLPLLKPNGGINHFKREMSMEGYIPEDGIGGDLSTQEVKYVQQLIDLARLNHRTPVLTCTRTLGRIAGLKRAFGGFHILLIRNLFSQWQSYIYQMEAGNLYFISSILSILDNQEKDKFIAFLREYLVQRNGAEFTVHNCKIEDMFLVFLLTHIYLYMNAIEEVDYLFDVTSASNFQPEDLNAVAQTIFEHTGIQIDIHDIRNETAPAIFMFNDLGIIIKTSEIFFDIACQFLNASPMQTRFGRKLLHETFAQYRSLLPIMERCKTDLASKASPVTNNIEAASTVPTVDYDLLKEEYSRLETVKNEMNVRIVEGQKAYEALKNEYDQLIIIKSKTELDHARNQESYAGIKSEYEQLKKIIDESDSQNKLVQEHYNTLQQQHDLLRIEYEQAVYVKNKFEEKLNVEISKSDDMELNFRNLNESYAALNYEYSKLIIIKDELYSNNNQLKENFNILQQERDAIQNEYEQAVNVKNQFEELLNLAISKSENLELSLESKTRVVGNLQIELEGKTTKLDDLKGDYEKVEELLQSEKHTTTTLREALKAQMEQIDKQSVRIEYYRQEIQKLNETIAEQDELILRNNTVNANLSNKLEHFRSQPPLGRFFNKP